MGLRGFALTAALLAIQAALMDRYYRQTLTQEPGAAAVQQAAWSNATCSAPAAADNSQECDPARSPRIKVLDAEARIFLYENFLTDEECDHIIKLAEPTMQRSGVVETQTGKHKVDKVRTSKGTFLRRGHDAVIANIEERIAKWTLMPAGNGEGLQVLRYDVGEEYEGHYDYFFHKEGTANGGNRYLTVLTYLNDVEEGGETTFPNIPAPGGDNGPEFSDCARKVLAAKPKKGNAVLFHSIKPNGELERKSLHTAWVHVGHYATGGETPQNILQKPQVDQNYPDCQDKDGMCESWAGNGECEKNPVYMIGSKDRPGHCIKACGKCADFYEFKATQRTR